MCVFLAHQVTEVAQAWIIRDETKNQNVHMYNLETASGSVEHSYSDLVHVQSIVDVSGMINVVALALGFLGPNMMPRIAPAL
jgi:hypothetical protein